ncbi:MAG: bifunctional metallophosphatase/5'-nucleotidase [Erysipelotrichales bacterium]|nr:bifunctional metallophosphatase/5'-nucleotidase [Erysipelotrichales bacterium]
MKKRSNLFLLTLLSLTLTGCTINFVVGDSTSDKTSNSNSESTSVSTPTSDSDDSISINYDTDRFVRLYAINDFHGAVNENALNSEPGIVKLGAYLKEKKSEGNTLLINSGDMWQGSIESNYNRGNLLTDCMNNIEFDCFTLGNHEFDWGQKYIQLNRERSSTTGYQTPFLASNIYEFDIGTKTVGEYADLGDKYVIRDLDNGLRVGIIGVIGKDQITSITSQYVDDINFNDPTSVVKTLSDELRTEHSVDVVILDCHTDQSTITGTNYNDDDLVDRNQITSVSNVSKQRYVDAVFCAHSHWEEKAMINGVPFIQGGSYGKYISNVELYVDTNGNVTCETYKNLKSTTVTKGYYDEELAELVNTYKQVSDEASNEVLGTFNGQFMSSGSLPNLVCEAIAEYATKSGYDISYAMVNNARATVDSGTVTYGGLYRALPFDNEIFIIDALGSTLKTELEYDSNFMCRLDSERIDVNKTYRIAVIDYLATHRNSKRDYNYFPGMTIVGKLEKDGYDIYNYRDVTADYIREKGSFDYWNYLSTKDKFNTNKINSAI